MASGTVGDRLGTVTRSAASVDLWFAWVGDHVRQVDQFSRDYLSREETLHLGQYRSRSAAERYVVTRSLVRIVLAERLGVAPRDIPVSRTDTGKPIVAEGVHFNVSHSGDLILLAFSEERPVGVDVERRREVPRVHALSARWLTLTEKEDFDRRRALGATDSDAFLRVWSLKEARLKALGVGISGALAAQQMSVDAVALDHLLDPLVGEHVGQGYVGAVAFA
jgi:4'-phosphopantetheinyl transferase